MPTTTFPFRKAKALLSKSRKAARPVSIEVDDGLTHEHVDPLNLLAAFPTLKLKPGYTLHTQLYSSGGNGNGFTWAYPATAKLPPVHLTKWPDRKPSHAEPPMLAVEGDGTPWSYLAASFLGRELAELGAQWHGCSWSEHELYGGGSLPGAASDWEYTEARPGSYLPSVTVEEQSLTVVFYTVTGLGQYRLERHVDIYRPGLGLHFEAESQTVARGPGGFVF